ncbi:MAG: preprotein translocase subunit SecG [Actinomycetota bacterium]|nr:preprotein translocase subunit SecG [Actinomycetota bacterium]
MGILKIVLIVIHVIVSIGLIIGVLLHAGSQGGLSGIFGGGGGSMFSGSYIIEKNLDKITIVLGAVFAATTIALVWVFSPK